MNKFNKSKKWHILHAKGIQKREATHLPRLRLYKAGLKKAAPQWIVVSAPPGMSFDQDYEATIKVINELIENVCVLHNHTLLDLSHCQNMSYDAMVVLGATIDRCKKLHPDLITGNYPPSPHLNFLLKELGFYKLIDVRSFAPNLGIKPNIHISQMESRSIEVKGSPRELIRSMRPLFDNIKTPETRKTIKQLYRGLSEVMLNVVEHAYPPVLLEDPIVIPRWWSAGFSDRDKGQVTIVFYDQGAGIPNTLDGAKTAKENSLDWKSAIRDLSNLLGREPKDSEKIQMAMELGRTSKINPSGMGKGLPDTKRLFDNADGRLKIYSYQGGYTLTVTNGHENEPTTRDSSTPIKGTLVIWKIENVR